MYHNKCVIFCVYMCIIIHVGFDECTGDTITVEKNNSHCNVSIIRCCLTL